MKQITFSLSPLGPASSSPRTEHTPVTGAEMVPLETYLSGRTTKPERTQLVKCLKRLFEDSELQFQYAEKAVYGSFFQRLVFVAKSVLTYQVRLLANLRSAFDETVTHSKLDAAVKISAILRKHDHAFIRLPECRWAAIKVTRHGRSHIAIVDGDSDLDSLVAEYPEFAHIRKILIRKMLRNDRQRIGAANDDVPVSTWCA